MNQHFSQLSLKPSLLQNLTKLGFEQMTAIQQAALPAMLSGEDVLAKAETGSGKTLAFALPMLNQLQSDAGFIQGLVLCPTRELAEQVADTIRQQAKAIGNVKVLTLCGGVPFPGQIQSLRQGADIVVGTPGRLLAHMEKHRLPLKQLQTLVLDEADRMLDLGFADDIMAIVNACNRARQTLLFSATYPEDILAIAGSIQRNAKQITVDASHTNRNIAHQFIRTGDQQRLDITAKLLSTQQPKRCIIFCNTKKDCQNLCDFLQDKGFSALALQGDLEQGERQEVLVQFSNHSALVLVATDVAARGLDIEDVPLVISWQPAHTPETHTHRIGRTGRAGAQGQAITLVSSEDNTPEHKAALAIADLHSAQDNTQTGDGIPFSKPGLLEYHRNRALQPEFKTLKIFAGKKQKLRAGDLVGALTRQAEIPATDLGDIDIFEQSAFIAIKIRSVKRAMQQFREGKIKGKSFKARKLS